MTSSVLTLVPAERSGMAASTVNTSRELGGVFGVAVLGAIVDAQLTAHLARKLGELGVPANFRSLVVDAVTHGGLPTSPSAVSNPAAAGHETLVAQVIHAAEDAFGAGLHVALVLAAALLLATAVVAALGQTAAAPTERRRRDRRGEEPAGVS